jgi:predicted component of type VI protein secretion system
MFWRKMGSLGAVAGAAGGAISGGGKRLVEVGKTMLGGGGKKNGTVLAKLHIITARRDLEGKDFKIYTNKTTIGRDPRLCDVMLYEEDEESSVSGAHCTIQYDRGRFIITDDNSSNGTEINGVPLPANSPQVLTDGDEIVLGDLFYRGAKFRFEIVDKTPPVDYANTPFNAGNSEGYAGETILDLHGSEEDVSDMAFDEANQDTMFGDEHHNFFDEPLNKETDWLDGLE